jgi:uncharacterized protein CbrC (UPF0167 family)
MTTFKQLGMAFPLFDAPVEDAAEYAGIGKCSFCSAEAHNFRLGIGCFVLVACPNCGAETGLDADDQVGASCRSCGQAIEFPLMEGEEVRICYSCLRSGRAAIAKDTEFGAVSWEQALSGVTHGVPGLNTDKFPVVEVGDGWFGAVIPTQHLRELLRSPTPSTIQGETWQFCCQQPMTFVGRWSRENLTHFAPDGDGRAYLDRLLCKRVPGLWEDELHDITGIYVFRCSSCGREVATWDIA